MFKVYAVQRCRLGDDRWETVKAFLRDKDAEAYMSHLAERADYKKYLLTVCEIEVCESLEELEGEV